MVRSSASSEVKRKMVKIGTHNGSFHCDEALGCFLLKRTDHFKDADIVRTRDEDVLKQLDIVIDVGGKYDPGEHLSGYLLKDLNSLFGLFTACMYGKVMAAEPCALVCQCNQCFLVTKVFVLRCLQVRSSSARIC